MAAPTPKTNAVRLLEAMGVHPVLRAYAIGPDEHLDAVQVARLVGADPDRVFKTLVARGASGRVLAFVLPGTLELKPKLAARAAGEQRIELVKLAELTELTGYLRGGCTALGTKKPLPVYLDESARLFETVIVSAGLRGLQMELAPDALLAACLAQGSPAAAYAELC